MAAEVTVLQAYQELQNQLVMYQLVLLFAVTALVLCVIMFMPMIPWLFSKLFTKKTVIALMDKSRNVKFKGGFGLRNGMYHNKDRNLYFVKKYPGVFYFSGVPIDFCHIDLGFVQHPEYNKFIAELKKMGYATWKDVETALEFNTIDPSDDETIKELGFASYEEARKRLNPGNLTRKSEILAPYFSSCPLDELIGYGADVPPASIAGEIDDVVLSQQNPVQSGVVALIPYAVFLAIVIIAGALGYVIITSR